MLSDELTHKKEERRKVIKVKDFVTDYGTISLNGLVLIVIWLALNGNDKLESIDNRVGAIDTRQQLTLQRLSILEESQKEIKKAATDHSLNDDKKISELVLELNKIKYQNFNGAPR